MVAAAVKAGTAAELPDLLPYSGLHGGRIREKNRRARRTAIDTSTRVEDGEAERVDVGVDASGSAKTNVGLGVVVV